MSDTVLLNLTAIRMQAKMTRKDWADAIGVSEATVKNWEQGKGEPKLSVANKMSQLSGVPLENFLWSNPTT